MEKIRMMTPLVEAAAENDEGLMEKFFESETLTEDEPNIQGFQGKADLPWVSRGLRRGRKT